MDYMCKTTLNARKNLVEQATLPKPDASRRHKPLDITCAKYILCSMPQSPIIPFRANEQDRERLEYLKPKYGNKAAKVLREGLKKLYDEDKREDK